VGVGGGGGGGERVQGGREKVDPHRLTGGGKKRNVGLCLAERRALRKRGDKRKRGSQTKGAKKNYEL